MLQEKVGYQPPVFEVGLTSRAAPQSHTLRLEVFENEQATTAAAANFLAQELQIKPASILLLPTGRTPLLMYAHLVGLVQQAQLNLSQVQTFNLDEFYGLAPAHSGSYHTYMQRVLFDHVPIAVRHINLLNGMAFDVVAECAAYEAKILAVGGIDVAVLGLGANGHIGFNEPGSPLNSLTRLVTIQPETRAANAFLFNNQIEAVPTKALTTGIFTIMQARRIILIATGLSKAQAIAALLYGPVTPELPASCLRLHPDVTLLVDQKASQEICQVQTD